MGTITVTPEKFTMVSFQVEPIVAIASRLAQQLGISDDITIEVDETTPVARASVATYSPIKLHIESGALEDPRRPRRLSERGTADAVGRLLFRVADRRAAFADAPGDSDLTLPQSIAWDVYSFGRLERLGYAVQRPRWQYHFRNRHGFTDYVDAVFDQIWNGEGLSWTDIRRMSDDAKAKSLA